jgi:hypothetical protein
MKYFTNGWNWVHLCYGFWLPVMGAAMFKNTPSYFFLLLALLTDILKEILDQVASFRGSTFMFKLGFDPAGADPKDVGMCSVGILMALYALSRLC